MKELLIIYGVLLGIVLFALAEIGQWEDQERHEHQVMNQSFAIGREP